MLLSIDLHWMGDDSQAVWSSIVISLKIEQSHTSLGDTARQVSCIGLFSVSVLGLR